MDSIYSHDCFSESWIEVSSQASSSSVSSIPADDAHRHALGLPSNRYAQRRRRLMRNIASGPSQTMMRTSSTATSSQDEYEESESESDRILTSSNENVTARSEGISPAAPSSTSEEAEEEEDENATALGVGTNERVFTPAANVFSHPPQPSGTRHARSLETRTSYFPSAHRTSPNRRPPASSYPPRTVRAGGGHTPYNMISPSHRIDHDAALRASLSTLLSCAAAARGLPKQDERSSPANNTTAAAALRIQPPTLSLVPESELPSSSDHPPDLPPRPRSRSSTSDKGKRKASSSKDRRNKKKRRANSPGVKAKQEASADQLVSPTLLTWVVSAGVVVLFSAISFSAGYAVGKEVGRVETLGGKDGVVCGKEVGRGLRRLRWGGSSVSVIRV